MPFYANADEAPAELIRRGISNRQWLLRTETEDFLRDESERIVERRKKFWNWDYSSIEAFAKSVEPNRKRWRQAVGDFGPVASDFNPVWEPFLEDDKIIARWVTLDFLGSIRARAVIALPKNARGKLPLVICQHGISSSPERVFGFDDPSDIYRSYGRRLAEQGYAVLAPMNITEGPPRARLQRICLMLGGTLWGLEIRKIQHLLDFACTLPEIDAGRIAMWGISLGGAYTIFTTPLEPRIKVAICCAWFNHRVKKMVFDDPRYSCFLSTTEEHIFIPGWLREFSDSDLVSLICPRAFMSQTGKADAIAWWPFVQQEFEAAREHYEKLGIAERIELDLHELGHEIHYDEGLSFLEKWL